MIDLATALATPVAHCEVCETRDAEGVTEATDASPPCHRCRDCAASTAGAFYPYDANARLQSLYLREIAKLDRQIKRLQDMKFADLGNAQLWADLSDIEVTLHTARVRVEEKLRDASEAR